MKLWNLYFDVENIASLFNISSYMLWILGYRHGWGCWRWVIHSILPRLRRINIPATASRGQHFYKWWSMFFPKAHVNAQELQHLGSKNGMIIYPLKDLLLWFTKDVATPRNWWVSNWQAFREKPPCFHKMMELWNFSQKNKFPWPLNSQSDRGFLNSTAQLRLLG